MKELLEEHPLKQSLKKGIEKVQRHYNELQISTSQLEVINQQLNQSTQSLTSSLQELFVPIQENLQRLLEDQLTKLGNRVVVDELEQSINHRSIDVVVFFIDLNRFKELNDSRGQEAGDHGLRLVSQRLKKACEENKGIPCRLGGDEFVIYAEPEFSHEIRDALSETMKEIPVLLPSPKQTESAPENQNIEKKKPFLLSGSVGYAPSDSLIGVKKAMKNAELACKLAKLQAVTVLKWDESMEKREPKTMRKRCMKCNATTSIMIPFGAKGKGLSYCPHCKTPFEKEVATKT